MSFQIQADLNQAHEQTMSLWEKLTKPDSRRLRILSEKTMTDTVRYYGDDTLSSKCYAASDTGFLYGDELKAGFVGVSDWNGSIRITAVVSFFIETHIGNDPAYNEDVRKFAREIVLFKCYSLVSRAGINVCRVAANTYGGIQTARGRRAFDYSRPDGGLSAEDLRPGPFNIPAFSVADVMLSNDGRASELRTFSQACYDVPESQERSSMSDWCTAWTGQKYEVAARITGDLDCVTEMEMRYKI